MSHQADTTNPQTFLTAPSPSTDGDLNYHRLLHKYRMRITSHTTLNIPFRGLGLYLYFRKPPFKIRISCPPCTVLGVPPPAATRFCLCINSLIHKLVSRLFLSNTIFNLPRVHLWATAPAPKAYKVIIKNLVVHAAHLSHRRIIYCSLGWCSYSRFYVPHPARIAVC